MRAFLQALRDLGYVEGQNLVMESRYAEGSQERLRDMAAELVRLKVDVIMAVAAPGTRAVQHATRTIPIVMTGMACDRSGSRSVEIVRVYEDGDAPGARHDLLEQLEQFRHEFRDRIG